jgi:hypothetical protein
LAGLALLDAAGDLVGLLFVAVAGRAEPTWQRKSLSLLNGVSGFVGGGVQAGGLAKDNMTLGAIGLRAQGQAAVLRGRTQVGRDLGHVVMPKRRLDAIGKRQLLTAARHPRLGHLLRAALLAG